MYFSQSEPPYSQTYNDINKREVGESEEWREGWKERGREEGRGMQGMKEEGKEGGNYKWHKHLWRSECRDLLFMQTETVEKPVY